MLKEPVKKHIGTLVEKNHKYFIPNFQRAYAWKPKHLIQFWQDIMYCAEQGLLGNNVTHYMGEIFLHRKERDFNGNEVFQVIDGQQRLTTYLILCSCMGRLLHELLPSLSADKKEIAESIIRNINGKLFYSSADGRQFRLETKTQDQLLLTTRIMETFDNAPTITELSGTQLIKDAFSYFNKQLDIIKSKPNIIDIVKAIDLTVNEKCFIIQLEVEQLADVYGLFSTVNNRGLLLTVGELLRAKTIEAFRDDQARQNIAEGYWNSILADDVEGADKLLEQVYISFFGEEIGKSSELFEKYLDKYFSGAKQRVLSESDRIILLNSLDGLKKELVITRKLNNAEWPYTESTLPHWKKDRLRTLLKLLNHSGSLPLLIAARQLDENKFYRILSKIELFFFNAKVIHNVHPGKFMNVYYQEIKKIRNSPSTYNPSVLITELKRIRTEELCDSNFISAVPSLQYGSTKANTIKYFLYMINLFYTSFDAAGYTAPTSAIRYDFDGLNIEHIYPIRAGRATNLALESLKNTIGNLVIMCSEINSRKLKNKPFSVKKPYYKNCGFKSVESLYTISVWNETEIENRKTKYLELAQKIFIDDNSI